jgi:hypothetical protein
VEIYLTLDHPHVARLLKVYEDEQVRFDEESDE